MTHSGDGEARLEKLRAEQAVALRYDGVGAPKVIAKGRGEVAERIVAAANKHNVPLHADQDLARVLATLELDTEVPPALYLAVAEVLAFAYRLSGTKPPHAGD